MKKFPILFFIILTPFIAFSQGVVGKVYDAASGETLPGARILWRGTTQGVLADSTGHFLLQRHPSSHILIVTSLGYHTDSLIIHSDTTVDVRLSPLSTNLRKVSVRARKRANYSKVSSIEQTEVITTEGLRALACCNLGESFQNSATVDVNYSDAVSGSKQIQLLGLGGIYSQMLLENLPFLRGLAAPFGLGYVPGQWLEGISVSKGVATVKNGFEAITGTINLEYEKPHNGDRFSLNLYENSDLRSELTAKANHRFNERLSTGIYLYATADTRTTDHLGHDGFSDYPVGRQINVLNRWHYRNDKGFISQTLINYLHEERLGGDIRYSLAMRGNDSIYGFGGNSDRLYFFSKNGFPISNTATFGAQLSGSLFRQEAWYGMSTYQSDEKELYVNLLVNVEVSGGHILDYGLSLHYDYSREQLNYLPWQGYCYNYNQPETQVVPGFFVQYTFRYGDRFNVTGGLRVDRLTLIDESSQWLLTPRIHFRWNIGHDWIMRGSVGRGFRTVNIIAENMGILASNRRIIINSPLHKEDAWNGGLNITKKITIATDRQITFSADFYHTEFVNQAVLDFDVDPYQVVIGDLQGRSFSNVLQVDFSIEPIEGLSLSLAGKINDVRCNYHGVLMRKPYTSFWKGLTVISYHTRFDKWRFDLTTQLCGPQRLPLNKGTLQGNSSAYIYMLGQLTRRFKRFEVYGGVENLTDHVQDNPIIAYDRPFSEVFDASVVYAPLMGRLFYIGIRVNLL